MSSRFHDHVKITDSDVVEHFRQVEGVDYCPDGVLIDYSGTRNAGRPAIDVWYEWQDRAAQESDAEWRAVLLSKTLTGIVIYGDCGWNRYLVCGDGVIIFSTGHAAAKGQTEQARAAGFWIGPR